MKVSEPQDLVKAPHFKKINTVVGIGIPYIYKKNLKNKINYKALKTTIKGLSRIKVAERSDH